MIAGQHRRHYRDSAVLLAAIAGIKEDMGENRSEAGDFCPV